MTSPTEHSPQHSKSNQGRYATHNFSLFKFHSLVLKIGAALINIIAVPGPTSEGLCSPQSVDNR
jgi:hypothetical protein